MADVIGNHCEAEVTFNMGLVQFVVPSKFIKSDTCPEMSI